MSVDAPLFSIITPVFRTPLEYLEACIASVEAQTFDRWELLLIDNGNEAAFVDWLLRRTASDPRLRVIRSLENLGIGGGSQLGVEAARGEFLALLDHDDTLSPVALARMAEAIQREPTADYLYSDEDKIESLEDGRWTYTLPFFKPDWSPERFRHHMYTCHLSVLRTNLVRDVGGFRSDFDGSQDYDLVLRVTEKARAIMHIPEVLYHWRAHTGSTALVTEQKPYAYEAARRAIQDHCDRTGLGATVEQGSHPGVYRVKRRIREEPLVSLLLPIYGKSAPIRETVEPLALHLVDSIERVTTYRNFEYVICYDSKMDLSLLSEIERRCTRPARFIEYVEPAEGFNFSTKVNMCAVRSAGEYLIVLNDDIEVITPEWVEELISHAQDHTVGAVGGMYFFEDETIQHAGVACAAGPYHLFYGFPRGTTVFGNHLQVARECAVLTAACLAVRREAFFAVGGFTELLPNNFNDVDFCLKLRSRGLRNIWTPHVEMYHFESKSRVNTVRLFEIEALADRWGRRLYVDPFYNPNLNGQSPTWQHFDDWDEATRQWPELVQSLAQLDVPRYLEMNADLAAEVERDPTWDVAGHFVRAGRYENRVQSMKRPRHPQDRNRIAHGLSRVRATPENYDRDAYLRANPDLRAAAAEDPRWDPYDHLVTFGVDEGRYMLVLCGNESDELALVETMKSTRRSLISAEQNGLA